MLLSLWGVGLSRAEDDLDKEIQKKTKELVTKETELEKVKAKANEITANLNNFSKNLTVTQSQINSVESQINELSADISNLSRKLEIKKDELDEKSKVKDIVLRDMYIATQRNFMDLFFTGGSLSEGSQIANYYFAFIDTSNNLIELVGKEIKGYEDAKTEIEGLKTQAEGQKKSLQALSARLAAQVAATQNDLSSVSQKQLALQQEKQQIQRKLSELSAAQKGLLDEKTETFSTSVGDVPSTGDASSGAGFNPGFKKAFAGFSFGAPHRKGMSQYGAKGRADAGQDYKQILRAYYGDVEIKEVEVPDNIKTDKGTMSFEGKYLKGMAEMPSSWPIEALKAQAVAARTYALARQGWAMGSSSIPGTICTTENCQVWSESKATSSSAARWHDAVSKTKKQVLVSKKTGQIFSTYYAATSGGYNYGYSSNGHNTGGGWDTECGSRECWTSKAYESKASSPWFYKGWYKTRSGQSCSRSHPWLSEKEFADIVGAVVLYKESSNNQTHLSQLDAKSCWGKNIDGTWSMDKVREESGIKEVSDVKVSYSSSGFTSEVRITTNKGELKFSGEDFRAIFNLRAPGALQLKSALFNIEVRK